MIDRLIQITNNRETMVLQNDVNSCLLVSANHALRWNANAKTRPKYDPRTTQAGNQSGIHYGSRRKPIIWH